MTKPERSCLSIVLAAGNGIRMKSARPKVLHEIAGLSMINHVIKTLVSSGLETISVVAGKHINQITDTVQSLFPKVSMRKQEIPKGTAHAVLATKDLFVRGYDDILIVYGDTPFFDSSFIKEAREALAKGSHVVVGVFSTSNPYGYGRIIEKEGAVVAIREEKDCCEEEKKIKLCNAGFMAISGKIITQLLEAVQNNNKKEEFYLTDSVEIANKKGLRVDKISLSPEVALGVNTLVDLSKAENFWQQKRRKEMMEAGVTLLMPETIFFSYDTHIDCDSLIEPHVFFGKGVNIASGVRIRSFSYIEGASIKKGSDIGPFTRIRCETEIQENVKIGNFVEIKQAFVEKNAKINHLSYIGDAHVGESSNIGAGSITCNYDGQKKSFTKIGERAFIGSNSSLVAPLSIGKAAYIASGSVVTENVPDEALVFGRARQTILAGRAKSLRGKAKKE